MCSEVRYQPRGVWAAPQLRVPARPPVRGASCASPSGAGRGARAPAPAAPHLHPEATTSSLGAGSGTDPSSQQVCKLSTLQLSHVPASAISAGY